MKTSSYHFKITFNQQNGISLLYEFSKFLLQKHHQQNGNVSSGVIYNTKYRNINDIYEGEGK